MNYAGRYHYKEQALPLKDGEYDVELEEPFETDVAGYHVLRFPFKVVGIRENVVPNYFDLFDVSNELDEKQVQLFERNASKIKACFLLQGDFVPTSYFTWKGRRGRIVVKKQESGFINVVNFLRHPDYEGFKHLL